MQYGECVHYQHNAIKQIHNMTTINNYLQEETNKLINDCDVFFAFSQSQMKEGIDKLKEKYNSTADNKLKLTDIGSGGFIPSINLDKYIQGHKDIDKQYKKLKKDEKAKNEYILYELHNHEVFYTGNINDFCSTYMSDIPKEEIISVYKSHTKSKCGCNK
jgi:ATP-dependent Clp protease ATP-binding subunit ClpA